MGIKMNSYFNRVRDRNNQIGNVILDNDFLILSFIANTGTIEIEVNNHFCDFMMKHNSLYTMECFYDEIVMMLENKFNKKPLMFNDELLTMVVMGIDMIIMKYIHRFDSMCMYSLEMNNEK